jgi:hypothetical protein
MLKKCFSKVVISHIQYIKVKMRITPSKICQNLKSTNIKVLIGFPNQNHAFGVIITLRPYFLSISDLYCKNYLNLKLDIVEYMYIFTSQAKYFANYMKI